MPKYNDPRYGGNSVIAHANDQLLSLANGGNLWPMSLTRLLFHRYVVESMCFDQMAHLFERSLDGVWTKIKKTAIACGEKGGGSAHIYTSPSSFEPIRTGLDFNYRDKRIISLATGAAGMKYGISFRPEYIASMLRRTDEEVRDRMFKLANPSGGLGVKKPVTDDAVIASRVHLVLRRMLKNASRDDI